MLNPDLPLTPMEWPEWGNPVEDEEAFHYIRSYTCRSGQCPRLSAHAGDRWLERPSRHLLGTREVGGEAAAH